MKNLGKGAKIAMGVFLAVIVIGAAVLYIMGPASNDVNQYLCGMQSDWGNATHFHFNKFGDTKSDFDCPVN